MHQLAGASRKDFLKRKKIAGGSASGGGKVEEDEENVEEEVTLRHEVELSPVNEPISDVRTSKTQKPTRKSPSETHVEIKKFQEVIGDGFVVQEKYVFLVMRLWTVVQGLRSVPGFRLLEALEGCMTNKHVTDLKYREHKMVLTNNEVTIKWFQYPTENQGRYAVEVWYGNGDYQVEMNLKEAAKMLQLAGASRKDSLRGRRLLEDLPVKEKLRRM
ncbi:hypothetical protein TWF225_004964 [Orbilia oligospora]|uniref:Uncharacterized protein n=1 Tax=Orbilia oligospora TaxID=2813651 RepID=A0A7C8K5E8_ORBOL|nr:hypothetical protein TWF751_011115 [Orbilia oligospora]KAF3185993.1 hypothetical protein TWF225_004964 [Orbilia oligospora]KAF3264957.1 hypothetical protein TWF217_002613 [Orbilia oligospora]KAF3268258.1 hypothetical protein TWF128_008256 [Orbilia oligospora]KAF3295896.1 hypothetical protein TWF132_000444 [Orbilia oligospora]